MLETCGGTCYAPRWDLFGTSLGLVSALLVTCLIPLRDLFGTCSGTLWDLFGTSLEHSSLIPLRSLAPSEPLTLWFPFKEAAKLVRSGSAPKQFDVAIRLDCFTVGTNDDTLQVASAADPLQSEKYSKRNSCVCFGFEEVSQMLS